MIISTPRRLNILVRILDRKDLHFPGVSKLESSSSGGLKSNLSKPSVYISLVTSSWEYRVKDTFVISILGAAALIIDVF